MNRPWLSHDKILIKLMAFSSIVKKAIKLMLFSHNSFFFPVHVPFCLFPLSPLFPLLNAQRPCREELNGLGDNDNLTTDPLLVAFLAPL